MASTGRYPLHVMPFAGAQGLAAIRGNEWVAGIGDGPNVVKVSVADVRVEHEVRLMDFIGWLERSSADLRSNTLAQPRACRFSAPRVSLL